MSRVRFPPAARQLLKSNTITPRTLVRMNALVSSPLASKELTMPVPRSSNGFFSNTLRRWYWALAVALTLAIWALLALALRPVQDADGSYASRPYGLVTNLENQSLDILFQLRNALRPQLKERGASDPVTIIEIDERTIKASGVRLQKWPRGWYAQLVDRASAGGASVIGLDVFLSEAGGTTSEDKAHDEQMAAAITNAGNVVVASKLEAGGFPAIEPLPTFAEGAYAVGFVDLPLDADGFMRSAQLSRTRASDSNADASPDLSFATRVAEAHLLTNHLAKNRPLENFYDEQGFKSLDYGMVRIGDRALPLRTDLNLQLDYRNRPPAFRRFSAGDLLFNKAAQIPDDLFRDRIVLIGASSVDTDLFATPFYEPLALAGLFDRSLTTAPVRTPGIEIHATAAATLLNGVALKRPRWVWQVLLLLVPLSLVALAIFGLRALWGFLTVVLVAAGSLAIASWAFNEHGLILPLSSAWLGAAGILAPAGFVLRYAHERALRDEKEAERAQVMDIFSRCVSPEVADALWQRRGHISMVGERRVVTIIFTDIRGFTTLSESAQSGEVVTTLND